jgi:uncharacterized BrkB/YihY/UPF0761 family membrane protein
MNKPEKFDEDILSRYISPERIEKAPEGFTQRTMIRLQSEKAPIAMREKSVKNYRVPVISALITFGLIIAAMLLSTSNEYIVDLSILKQTGNFNLPQFNIDKMISFTLPELLIYISVGILMLLLFDQLLNRVFHRERK